ncbi:MAG: RIP metalloprotease RseP [Bacteroidetes bacterium]|nr:RIP metalloprotease RseP [Bacteroidota bacterium]
MKLLQLFLSLTILVTLHEFGHFFFAKKFKCRVDKFYLFFDFLFPLAGVMNFALFKKKIGDTEYGIGWFPFGGYVSIAGMVDEQMDKTLTEKEPEPWEFRAKPAWQRLLILMGGILVNVLLGILIYWGVLFCWGKETLPIKKMQYGIACDSLALQMGFKNGDQIRSVDNKPIESLNRVALEMVMNRAQSVQIMRNGSEVNIPITADQIGLLLKDLKHSSFIGVRIPTEIDSVIKGSPAEKAGLQHGDRLLSINAQSTIFFDEFQQEIKKQADKKVELSLLRNNDTLRLSAAVSAEGTLGFFAEQKKFIQTEKTNYNIAQSFTQGMTDAYETIVMQAKQLVVVFTIKDAHKQVGGFYTMYKTMPDDWDWEYFWKRTAFLSLVLAFMNFLPVPMLDGGYIMFILIEMITRKKVSDKVLYYANYAGLLIILSLMIYANTDFLR